MEGEGVQGRTLLIYSIHTRRDSISSFLENVRLDPGGQLVLSGKYKLIPIRRLENLAVSTGVTWGGCNKQDGRRSGLLDVLTPLSDSRQESVQKMERRISGVSYMCWMDFHNAILCCRCLRARLISVYSVSILCLFCVYFVSSLFSGYHAAGYHAPSILHGLSRPGLSRLHHHCTATTLVYIFPGYHAIVLSYIPRLSHLSYHAPPHTYIGLSHPP